MRLAFQIVLASCKFAGGRNVSVCFNHLFFFYQKRQHLFFFKLLIICLYVHATFLELSRIAFFFPSLTRCYSYHNYVQYIMMYNTVDERTAEENTIQLQLYE